MKSKFIISVLFTFIIIGEINSQTHYYYWSNSRKIPLEQDNSTIVCSSSNFDDIVHLKETNWVENIEKLSEDIVVLTIKEPAINLDKAKSTLKGDFIHGFQSETGIKIITKNEILLKPKAEVPIEKITSVINSPIEITRSKYGTYKIKINNLNEVFNLSNKLYESGFVEYCHPNFIVQVLKFQNDPLYSDQYYHNQANNIDINAPQAWGASRGVNSVRVAVIDDGVEAHEDMGGRVLQGYTPTDPSGFGAPLPNPPIGNPVGHGQACAGIIGATIDNNLGIAGIAPCSDIIPINIFNGGEDTDDIASAIDWAWDDAGADVISNSWGYDDGVAFDNIEDAIQRALSQGRGGDGSIIIFAAGNDGGVVNFPADVDGVISVGAVRSNGNHWDYSSTGPQMDLVAPSGNVGLNGDLTTIDRTGSNGYETGNYTDRFGGTSAACPQVAGVAALMLSINPNLTEAEVKSILKTTATDMGSAGFDNTYGYGRVNAHAAVLQTIQSIYGDEILCNSNKTYTIMRPPGSAVSWSATPSSLFDVDSGSGSSFTTRAASSGQGTITATITGDCGSIQLVKEVWVGKPTNDEIDFGVWFSNPPYNQVAVNYPEAIGLFSNPNEFNQGVTGYRWQFGWWSSYITGYQTGTGGLDKYAVNINLDPSAYLSQIVHVAAENECGYDLLSNSKGKEFYREDSHSHFIIAPNPTSGVAVISVDDEKLEKEKVNVKDVKIYGIEVYDKGQRLQFKKEIKEASQREQIDLTDLYPGIYTVSIFDGKQWWSHHVVRE